MMQMQVAGTVARAFSSSRPARHRRPGRATAKGHGRPSIRGNHMNFGGPSAAGLADGLRSVFFNAPVPSGCTFTIVLSSDTASIRMRTTVPAATPRTRGPARRSWTNGSSAYRSYASCRSAWAARATCSRARRRTGWRSTAEVVILTLPRCVGRTGAMRRYCASLISISTQYQKIMK